MKLFRTDGNETVIIINRYHVYDADLFYMREVTWK